MTHFMLGPQDTKDLREDSVLWKIILSVTDSEMKHYLERILC